MGQDALLSDKAGETGGLSVLGAFEVTFGKSEDAEIGMGPVEMLHECRTWPIS